VNIISVYGSHNASVALYVNGNYEVIELERFLSQKNIGLAQYLPIVEPNHVIDSLLHYIKNKFYINEFDLCLYSNTDQLHNGLVDYKDFFPAIEYKWFYHHESHAAGTFYQSNFSNATIFSIDGGGSDGFFNVYKADRKNGLEKIGNEEIDLGFSYMLIGHYLKDIKFEPLNIGNLVYSGKLMGLCSYGKVRDEWLQHFINYYKMMPLNNFEEKMYTLKNLGDNIGVIFSTENRLEGQLAWDISATSQRAFEEVVFQYIKKYYTSGPICISGGCALNIILNSRIRNEITKEIFIAPNSNDCGLAVGALLNYIKPQEYVDLTYSGLPILDIDKLSSLVTKQNKIGIPEFSKLLLEDKIIGVLNGRSEHGPRALGNRSILCNAANKNMKNILNEKVKHREWFRPFGPIVRLEDCNKYFEFDGEARYMSYVATVREEWRDSLASITHVDNTARIQTVTRDQNQFIYDLLTELEKIGSIPVILNTSFNVDGKPIMTKIEDALIVLHNTELDYIYVEGYLIKK
jgi:carbamoyltransferase